MTKLPKMTKRPLLHVDMTPDENLPLRILEAYRENCNVKWKSPQKLKMLELMNEHCDQRAEILDRAIAVLRKAT